MEDEEKQTSFVKLMKDGENISLLSKSTVRRGGTFDFENELKRLKTINNIER